MLRFNGNTRKRIISSALAAVMTVSIIGTAVYMDSSKVHAARVTLRGIQELASTHSEGGDEGLNPFVIIEVVDDYNQASLGYLVGGEEPVDFKNEDAGGYAKAIKDMPSKDERTAKLTPFAGASSPLSGTAYSWASDPYAEADDAAHSYEIRGEFNFVDAGNGNYREGGATDGLEKLSDSTYNTDGDEKVNPDELEAINEAGAVLYREMSNYSVSEITSLKKMTDGDELPIADSTLNPSVDRDEDGNIDEGVFNWQYFAIDHTINGYDGFASGDRIYAGTGTLEYVGTIDSNTSNDDGTRIIVAHDKDGNEHTMEIADNGVTITSGGDTLLSGITFNDTYDWEAETPLVIVKPTNNDGSESNPYRIADGGANGAGLGTTSSKQINGEPGNYQASDVPDALSPYYVGGGLVSDYVYNEDPNDYAFKADYSKKLYETFRYNNGFTNYEWFKQYVLDRDADSEYASLSVDVVTIRADKLTAEDIKNAGLIYFNYPAKDNAETPADYVAKWEIDADVAATIVSRVSEQSLPVMMEYAVFGASTGGATPNLHKMAEDLTKSTVGDKDGKSEDISFAKGTLFVNDNYMCGSIVEADFDKPYGDDKIDSGFTRVKEENEAEYRFIQLQNIENAGDFVTHVSKATSIRYILNKNTNRVVVKDKLRILDIEPYDVSQYDEGAPEDSEANPLSDIFYDGTRYYDVRSYDAGVRDHMTKPWVETNLGFTGGTDKIDIRMIGTKEFIGINDDLNADFDLIYIGMDKALLNTRIRSDGHIKSNEETKYNRSSMNGLVYSHIGDEYYHFNNVRFGAPNDATITGAGNDITPDKVRELEEYIQAGYAVILSDGFFTSDDKINTTTVDSSSRMYQLMDWLVNGEGNKYLYKNVVKRSSLEASTGGYETNRSMFSTYLNVAKLEMELTRKPKAYTGEDDSYLDVENDGFVYLRFEAELTNNSAIDTSEQTTYDCNLYIDMDADGKYEEIEKLDGVSISDAEETDGHFNLTSGKTYSISRVIPEGYVGFLPWKIEFVQNGKVGDSYSADAVRISEVGYSAVKLVGAKPVINVLQIVQTDIDPESATTRSTYTLNLNDQTMTDLYAKINEFDVRVYQTNVQNYMEKKEQPNLGGAGYFRGTYYDFLAQFDIVVMGFADMYGFSSPEIDDADGYNILGTWRTRDQIYKDAALGIREYALKGRSMLFTHDLTHSAQQDKVDKNTNPGYYLGLYLRDIMGMDRYGMTIGPDSKYTYSFDSTNVLPHYDVVTDNNTLKGSTAGDTYGFTDPIILTRIRPDNGGGFNTGYPNDSNKYAINAKWTSNLYMHTTDSNETIQSINRGQITEYPFNIPEEVMVAPTHSQYYQLNLDTKSNDEFYDDDIVVWYALSNKDADGSGGDDRRDHRFYRSLYKDVRNNYYIYTKGNITYTGAGHRLIESDRLEERKLFVNTLVAAYANSKHSPKIIYKENPWDTAATISSTYVPYDAELAGSTSGTAATDGGFLDTQLTVNFKTMNSNIRSASYGLRTRYYVPVNSGGDITISDVQYKEIQPTSIKIVGMDGQLTAWPDAHNLSNFRIYQATFNLSDLNLSGTGTVISRDNAKLMIRCSMDEFQTITDGSLPAEESINELDIFATRLFNLE